MIFFIFKYVVKVSIVKIVFRYTAKAKSFDSAYKQFKRDIKKGEITSVKTVPSENLKKACQCLKNRWEGVKSERNNNNRNNQRNTKGIEHKKKSISKLDITGKNKRKCGK